MNPKKVLKKYYGYTSFRPGQEEIINAVLKHQDVVGIMPTGAGKSICYQIPALLFQGVTVVVSPLISLMKDQVNNLNKMGISACYLNSSLDKESYKSVLRGIYNDQYKLIYVAPERLLVPAFLKLTQQKLISFVAIDEAHCVSQWGQDFRPDYLKIIDFISQLPTRPVIGAYTATATTEVKKDIIKILHLNKPFSMTTGFNRPNLCFCVEAPQDKRQRLLQLISERPHQSGIIYCGTRKNVDMIHTLLLSKKYKATKYHAGLSEQARKNNQEDFVYDRNPIMVATNAFGMGIDKSNVAYIIHYNMPKSIETYYQ